MNLASREARPRGAVAALAVRPRATPVELVPAPRPAVARYVVRIGEVRIEVSDDFDATTLRRLVGVLRSC
jgi:hypothetical protein